MLIKFGKEMIEVGEVGGSTTLNELKERVEFATNCVDIKLILKGKHLNSNLQETIGSIPGGTLAKISAIGSRQSEINLVNHSQTDRNITRVVNDLNGVVRRTDATTSRSSDRRHSQYCFGGIQTLPGLPNESTARSILEELSVDIGVLAVMEKHKFKVGTLCELYPEGYVGVSDVCVMGLNEGNGIRILLRLRTDDLKGFRKILSIRKVLFHELAHNMHSDHDNKFYMLMRQIEREVVELDWRASKAKSIGGPMASNLYIPSESTSHQSRASKSDVHRLGGGQMSEDNGDGRTVLPARVAAGTAAIMRISEEESQAERHCGSSVVQRNTHLLPVDRIRIVDRTEDSREREGAGTGAGDDGRMIIDLEESRLCLAAAATKVTSDVTTTHDNAVVGNMDVDAVNSEFRSSMLEETHMDCYEPEHVITISLNPDNSMTAEMLNTATDSVPLTTYPHSTENGAPSNQMGDVNITTHAQPEGKSERGISESESERIIEQDAGAIALSAKVHLEYMAGCVLRQMDDVVSAALSTSESAFERVSMLREALAVLLSHGKEGEKGKGVGMGSTHITEDNSAYSSFRETIHPVSSVEDALDTMQILRTIIGNAKVTLSLSLSLTLPIDPSHYISSFLYLYLSTLHCTALHCTAQ